MAQRFKRPRRSIRTHRRTMNANELLQDVIDKIFSRSEEVDEMLDELEEIVPLDPAESHPPIRRMIEDLHQMLAITPAEERVNATVLFLTDTYHPHTLLLFRDLAEGCDGLLSDAQIEELHMSLITAVAMGNILDA